MPGNKPGPPKSRRPRSVVGSRPTVPAIPKELVAAAREGQLVLYVGSGMSAPAGFPTWSDLVTRLFEWRRQARRVPRKLVGSWRASLSRGDFNAVADSILSDADITSDRLAEFLRPLFQSQGKQSSWMELLPSLKPSAILSTNFGDLLERAFPGWSVFTPFAAEKILEAHTVNKPHIVKLYGRIDEPPTILLSPMQFEVAMVENRRFSNYMEAVFTTRTILFVGASVEGLASYLRGLRVASAAPHRHFALVADGEPGWRTRAGAISSRFGIRFIPFDSSADYSVLGQFLSALANEIKLSSSHTSMTPSASRQRVYVERLLLERIGPFERQEFELTPRWNVLIGDNGVGKSTILKAIAVAMSGDDAASYAGRIVKVGANHGSVTLNTSSGKTYRADIFLNDASAEVRTVPARPIEAEKWLVVGFPPLRSMPWTKPRTLPFEEPGRLTAADVLPLLSGDPDTRSEGVKQWLVGLDYRIRQGGQAGSVAHALRERFITGIERLLAASSIEKVYLHQGGSEIRVRTAEGELPLEAISQGAASVFGWMGVLLQRLADVESQPETLPTLVLVDEIDAHMHPTWQWTLVDLIRSLCPDVQFVVTSHSPLVVGSMNRDEVHVLKRQADGKVVVKRIAESLKGYRADQILTHESFGMESTRSQAMTGRLEQYDRLLAQEHISDAQQRELTSTVEALRADIPGSAEREEQRLAVSQLQQFLLDKITNLDEQKKRRVIDEAQQVLADLSAEPPQARPTA